MLSLALFLNVLRTGAVIVPDSIGYLDHWIIRPPLLPWLLDFSRVLLGPRYLLGAAAIQTVLLLASVHFLCRELRRTFSLGGLGYCGCYISLVFVMVPNPMLGVVGAQIASEAIAYSLFLVNIALLLPCLQERHPRRAAAALMVAAVNILSREQMFYAFFTTALFLVFLQRRQRGTALKTLLLATLCLACVSLANGAYHKAVNGSFSGPSWLYPHLWASLIFVCRHEDVALYAGDPEYPAIQGIFRYAEDNRLFAHHRRADNSSMSRHYMYKMPSIFFGGIVNAYKKQADQPMDSELFKRVSAASRRHFPVLLAKKLPQFAELFAIKLLQCLGVLDGFLAACFLVAWRAAPRSPIALALGLALAMLLANCLLLGLCNQIAPRYLITTTALTLVGCVLSASHLSRLRVHNEAMEL